MNDRGETPTSSWQLPDWTWLGRARRSQGGHQAAQHPLVVVAKRPPAGPAAITAAACTADRDRDNRPQAVGELAGWNCSWLWSPGIPWHKFYVSLWGTTVVATDATGGVRRIIRRADADQAGPVSSYQRRVWALAELAPASPAYNLCVALEVDGRLSVRALRRALAEMALRHEILRTSIAARRGEPVQLVAPPALPPLRVAARKDKDKDLAQQVTAEARRPFRLSYGPLWRAVLFRSKAADDVLVLCLHHAVCDDWSLRLLLDELAVLYPAVTAGALGDLPVQYGDFAVWEAARHAGPEVLASLSWWRERLFGLPAIELPADRPPGAGDEGAVVSRELPDSLTRNMKQMARAERASVFMLVLAAWAAVLRRHVSNDDVAVAVPVANRPSVELEPLIGFFTDTVVLRLQASGDITVRQLLRRAAEATLDAHEHVNAPFDLVVRAMQPARRDTHMPLVRTMLNHHPALPTEMTLGRLTARPREVHTGTAKFDVTISVVEHSEHIELTAEYRTARYESRSARRWLAQLEAALKEMVMAPERRVDELELLADTPMNGPAAMMPPGRIDELIAAQAALHPRALAVVSSAGSLSYRALDKKAGEIATLLREHGIGAGSIVGVCLRRKPDLLVALLAVWKSGGAWLLLDPDHPQLWRAGLLADAGASAMVCDRLRVVGLPGHRLPGSASDDLAYLIYTSGSTGEPKGVEISHRSLRNYLRWCVHAYDIAGGRGAVAHSSVAYDFGLTALLGPLVAGRTVTLTDELDSLADLARLLGEPGTPLSFVKLTPTDLMRLAEIMGPEPRWQPPLRLIVGGESLYAEQLRWWRANAPHTILVNEYGPTEATVGCCTFQVRLADLPTSGPVPIGHPIANTVLQVLDEHGRAVPAGAPGELWIGGAGIARGYHNRPTLTSQSFPRGQNEVRYRTGDCVRRRADGMLEHLGRLDDQVKINGIRVEFAEIEAAMMGHPAVRNAAVAARASPGGRLGLVGYIVGSATAAELRGWLADRVPSSLVPGRFVTLREIPRTSSGKLDRAALLVPQQPAIAPPERPATPAEATVLEIFADVLGRPRVTPTDNFFDLGGDSILAIQIVSRARRAGLHFTPRQLFQCQTARELAASARALSGASAEPVAGAVRLTPIQHWLFAQRLANPHHFNQAVMLQPVRKIDPPLVRAAVAALATHHDALRLRFARRSGGWRQWYAPAEASAAAFDFMELGSLPSRTDRIQEGLNLAAGPLLRVALLDGGGPPADRLLVVAHHLVVDAVSWRILLDDLETAYLQLEHGLAVDLPGKTTSFQAWAEHVAEHARTLGTYTSAWPRSAFSAVPRLPVDLPAAPDTVATASSHIMTFDAELTRALLNDVPRGLGARVEVSLLCGLGCALGRWTGAAINLVDVESHGRDERLGGVDLSRTVGWFTAMAPVPLPSGNPEEPREWLSATVGSLADTTRLAVDFGALRWLSPDPAARRRLAALPAPQVRFNYLGHVDRLLGRSTLFTLAPETAEPTSSPANKRTHMIELDAMVLDGTLRIELTSGARHRPETIAVLAETMGDTLRAISKAAQKRPMPRRPAIVAGLGVTSAELQAALAELAEAEPGDGRLRRR
jgi:amino acid adenylation domain-containing protein/non-ribosomal peptide synthase protein (TIGR01720 family)